MLVKLATRKLNCEYFIGDFLDYYINAGVDEIFIFDSDSEDNTKEIVDNYQKNNENINLAMISTQLRHVSEEAERDSCNVLFKFALNDFSENNEETWWIFADIDEFIRSSSHLDFKSWLKQQTSDMIRSIFIDWYLNPKLIKTMLKPIEILQLALDNKIKGKISELWGDPFCKDNLIKLNFENFEKYQNLKAGGGFHRWILNNQLILPSNKEFLIVDHLQGVPIDIIQRKVNGNFDLLKNIKDEWLKTHFQNVERIFDNYSTFYETSELKYKSELDRIIEEISNYNNDTSYFNNVIMKEYLKSAEGSKPSKHGYDGFDS